MKESTYIFNEDQCTLQDGTHILLGIQMLKKNSTGKYSYQNRARLVHA